MIYCPKCKKFVKTAHVSTRMNKPFDIPIWEVEEMCLHCGFTIWKPCEPPKKEKK